MGTRNLTIVVHKSEAKVAQYGQWEGNPEGNGLTVLSFLCDSSKVKQLKKILPKVRFQREDDLKKKKDFFISIGSQNGRMDLKQAELFKSQYPMHHRDVGGEILELLLKHKDLDEIVLVDAYSFAADSLWCEWAYVIDFDKNSFEVYAGVNTEEISKGDRFFPLYRKGAKYKPVKLFISFSLDMLPDEKEFIKHFR